MLARAEVIINLFLIDYFAFKEEENSGKPGSVTTQLERYRKFIVMYLVEENYLLSQSDFTDNPDVSVLVALSFNYSDLCCKCGLPLWDRTLPHTCPQSVPDVCYTCGDTFKSTCKRENDRHIVMTIFSG